MRARKKKNCDKRVEACSSLLINSPEEMISYTDKLPATLEIGCGKGSFICTLAKNNPDRFYFAAELITDVLVTALERAVDEGIENVRFLNINAVRLPEFFKKGDISKIHLNFSDPWPKSRHAKRRLTYHTFLDLYKNILSDDGVIEIKTDNDGLFEFTLEELALSDMKILRIERDLHKSDLAEGNVMTEYEKNFSEKGVPIKYVKVAYK